MLLIPMWQPHASAVALGLKKVETRKASVPKGYRGPVAIYATKKWDRQIGLICAALGEGIMQSINRGNSRLYGSSAMPLGKIIAVAELTDSAPAVDMIPNPAYPSVFRKYPELDVPLERALGNYAPTRWGWVLRDVKPLPEPVPYKAHQGVYTLDQQTACMVIQRAA